jgi:hypothetical protein
VGGEGRCEAAHVRVRVWGQDTRDCEAVQDGRVEVVAGASFWGEVRRSGDLSDVQTISKELNSIGTTETVGTRHRSAYRLCQRIHDALVVVISQDGWVRFVTWPNGGVIYWDHAVSSSDV